MRLRAHRQTFEIENYGPIGNLVEFFGSSCKLSRKTDPAVISAPSDRSRRKKNPKIDVCRFNLFLAQLYFKAIILRLQIPSNHELVSIFA